MAPQSDSTEHSSRSLSRRLMLIGIAGTAASALLTACGGGTNLLPTPTVPVSTLPATAAPVSTVAAATEAPVGANPTASSGQAGLPPTGAVATRVSATPIAAASTVAPTAAASTGTTAVATNRGSVSTAAAPSTVATTPTVNPTIATTPGTTATVDIANAQVQVHGLNQPASVPGWTVTVTKVERPGTDLVWSADNNTATATGTWVVVAVAMKKTANGTEGIAPDAFMLRSGEGFATPVPDEYWMTPDYYPTFKHSQPFGKSVPPGATVTYSIPFDVAEDATDLQFVFAQGPMPPVVFTIGNAHS